MRGFPQDAGKKPMQDFNNDNYNRNPYEKNGENPPETEKNELGGETENNQTAQDNQIDENPYADYYVHKSSGYVPPETPFDESADYGANSDSSGENGGYGNPYDNKDAVFKSGNANMPDKKGGNGMAVASLVLGILSLVFCCCGNFITMGLAATGLILGIIAQSKRSRGIAVAGNVTSAIGLVMGIIGVALMFYGMGTDIDSIFPFGSDYSPNDSSSPDFSRDNNNRASLNFGDIWFSIKLFFGIR